MVGQSHRVFLGSVIAQVKAVKPAFSQPAVKRAWGQPGGHGKIVDRLAMRRIARRNIAKRHIGMAGKQLCHRMNHDIRAMLQRPVGARRRKGAVDRQDKPARLCQCRDPCHVGHAQRRVRHHFNQNHPGFWPDRRRNRRHIGRVRQRGGDAESRQVLIHQPKRPTVKLIAPDDMIPRAQKPHQRGRHRCHARPGDQPALGPFQCIDLCGQHLGIRVPFARICVALQLPLILGIQLVGRLGCIDDRWLQRRANRPADAGGPGRAAHEVRGNVIGHGAGLL